MLFNTRYIQRITDKTILYIFHFGQKLKDIFPNIIYLQLNISIKGFSLNWWLSMEKLSEERKNCPKYQKKCPISLNKNER